MNAQTIRRFCAGLSEHSLFAYKEGNTMYAQHNELYAHCIDAHACYKKEGLHTCDKLAHIDSNRHLHQLYICIVSLNPFKPNGLSHSYQLE